MADGNDGGGSLRVPASCCGIFAMKPTRGRTPLGPEYAEGWHGLLCCHALSVSVRDSAALLDAVAGPDVGAPYYATPPSRPFLVEAGAVPGKLRIGYTVRPFVPATVHQDCLKGLEDTVRLCRDLGHEVEEAALEIDGPAFQRAFMTMVCGATMATIRGDEVRLKRKATSRDFEFGTWLIALLAKHYSSDEYARAIDHLKLTGRRVGAFLQKYDVLLTPTLAAPPLAIGALSPKGMLLVAAKAMARLNAGGMFKTSGSMDTVANQVFSFMPFTPLFNATGHPAMSVPLHWNEAGLPIGMQFVGRFGDEATLFRLAGQLEKGKPWIGRVPPVNAARK
jgi:amidase